VIITKMKEELREVLEEERSESAGSDEVEDPLASYKMSRDNISLFFIMKALGMAIGVYIGGHTSNIFNIESVYLLAAFLPLIVIFQGIFFFHESRSIFNSNLPDFIPRNFFQDLTAVKMVLTHPDVYYPLLVLFAYNFLPNIHHGLQWMVIDVHKFTPKVIGVSHLISGIIYIVCMCFARLYLKKYSLIGIFAFAMILNFVALPLNFMMTMETWNLSEATKILVFSSTTFFRKFTVELMMIPTFSRICAICPLNHEALIYTFMVALVNLSDSGSRFLGGLVLNGFDIKYGNYKGLWMVNLTNIGIAGLTLFMLLILAAVPTQEEIKIVGRDGTRKSWKRNDAITGAQREYLYTVYNQRKSQARLSQCSEENSF
jgi:hypothetical protein